MTLRDIIALRKSEKTKESSSRKILQKYADEKGLTEYKFDDGFYCFSNDNNGAEEKHREWMNSRIKDKNGVILKVGDVVHNMWGYDLVVKKRTKKRRVVRQTCMPERSFLRINPVCTCFK